MRQDPDDIVYQYETLKTRFRILLVVCIVLVVAGLGYAAMRIVAHNASAPTAQASAAITPGASASARPTPVPVVGSDNRKPPIGVTSHMPGGMEALVNGYRLRSMEIYLALVLDDGPSVYRTLVEDHLIIEEANKEKLTLDDASHMTEELRAKFRDAGNDKFYHMQNVEMQAWLYLRKIALKDIKEPEIRHVYDVLHDALKQYQVDVVYVDTAEEASKDEAALKQGTGGVTLKPLDSARLDQLRTMLGNAAAETVAGLAPGKTATILTPKGLAVVRLTHVLETYPELKTSVEDILINADRRAIVSKLASQAQISTAPWYLEMTTPAVAGPDQNPYGGPSGQPATDKDSVFAPPPEPPKKKK